MKKATLTWNHILSAVLHMPGVKVDRTRFLRSALSSYADSSRLAMLDSVRPYTIVSDKAIDSVARNVINRHTLLVTTASTVAGLPGGLALAATIPGDITQYYYHVVVVAQKLAYLYGFPDICDESGELNDTAADLLTIFMGSMMGVRVADQGISQLARGMARAAVGRLPRVAISAATIYPVAGTIARIAGLRLSREGFAKTASKLIPVAGGLFAGSLTLFTFAPGARRLQKRLKAQKHYFAEGDVEALQYANIRAAFVKAEQSDVHPEQQQRAIAQLLINTANLANTVTDAQYWVIEQYIARTDLSDDEKLQMLGTLSIGEAAPASYSHTVDYDVLVCDSKAVNQALRAMIRVARAGTGTISPAASVYLAKTAKTLGLDGRQLDHLLNTEH